MLFKEIREYFNKKISHDALFNNFSNNKKNLKLNIALGNYENDNNKNELNMFIHNHSLFKNIEKKEQEKEGDSQLNSLIQTHSYIDNNKEGEGNLFAESMQNISRIENINSTFLFGPDEDNNDN